MNPQITVYRRRTVENDPLPWQADIFLSNGDDHHGIGASPAEALLNAAMHWKSHEKPTA